MAYPHEAPWDPDQKYIESTVAFWAHEMAGRYRLTREDQEDFKQEMRLDLHERLRLYDASRASRRTFISRIAQHKAQSLIKHRNAQLRNPKMVKFSLDEPLDSRDADSNTYGDVVDANGVVGGRPDAGAEFERKVLTRMDLRVVLRGLSSELRAHCELIEADLPQGEIARRLGIHRDTENRRRAKIREILRSRGLEPRK